MDIEIHFKKSAVIIKIEERFVRTIFFEGLFYTRSAGGLAFGKIEFFKEIALPAFAITAKFYRAKF